MALTVADRGTGTHNTGATTLAPGGRSATIAAGSLGVLCIAADNAGSAGAALMGPASVVDSKGNTWTLRQDALYDNGAASAGIEMLIYTAPITTAFLTTDTLTITWAGGVSPVAKAWTWYQVTPSANAEVAYLTGGTIAGATAANGQVVTASVAVGDCVIAGYFSENVSAVTGDSDTTNGTWTAQQTATVGSTTSGVRIATQAKVQTTTASTQSYDPTVASQDRIAGYITLHEQHVAATTLTATGGGVAVPVGRKGGQATVTATGGGVAVTSRSSTRAAAATATGGGVATVARSSARSAAVTATGGGVIASTRVKGGQAAVTGAGGGVATITLAKGGQAAVTATGGGTIAYTYQVTSAEAHDGTASATGGGVATITAQGVHVGTITGTGGGQAAAVGAGGRSSSVTATGGGSAALSLAGAHVGSAGATGGGSANTAGSPGRQAAVTATGGGSASAVTSSARQAAVTATGGGSASASGTQVEYHQGSASATGGGTAALSATTARRAAITATGGGVGLLEGAAARVGGLTATSGGLVMLEASGAHLGSLSATGGGEASVIGGAVNALPPIIVATITLRGYSGAITGQVGRSTISRPALGGSLDEQVLEGVLE